MFGAVGVVMVAIPVLGYVSVSGITFALWVLTGGVFAAFGVVGIFESLTEADFSMTIRSRN